jgi:hypothetical protein
MRRALTPIFPALALLTIGAAPIPAAPQVAATYPNGTFLENMSLAADGSLLVTNYTGRSVLAWPGRGEPARWAELDAHPVGVLALPSGAIVSAHGASFMSGPAFTKTNQLIVLDRQGRLARRTPVADALFLNGLVALTPDIALVADSLAGRIWRFDHKTGAVKPWLSDPILLPGPAAGDQRPGANGLKRQGEWLYVSNSSRGALYRVKVRGDMPDGPLTLVAKTGPIDDFAFLSDGSIAATTHGRKLIRISAAGTVSDILADGCDACTSVVPLPASGQLAVVTTGNLLERGKEPAKLLLVADPSR